MRHRLRQLLLVLIIGVSCFSLGGLFFSPRVPSKPKPSRYRAEAVAQVKLFSPNKKHFIKAQIDTSESTTESSTFPTELCPKTRGRIGIFVVYTNYTEYMHATNVLRCFAQSRQYTFFLVQPFEDPESVKHCNHLQDVLFRKHCVASLYVTKVDWLYVCDADTAVVQATHCLEEYIDDKADIVFYERFFSAEITSGNYLVRNTQAARRFLIEWSLIEKEVPPAPYFFSGDNGAIHVLFLRTLYPNNTRLHKRCSAPLKKSIWPDFEPGYGPFVVCTKKSLQRYKFALAKRRAKLPYIRLKMISRSQAWVRDVEDTRFMLWEGDFMAHSIKQSRPFEPEMLQRLGLYASGQIPAECLDPFWEPKLIDEVKEIGVSAMRRELKYLGEFMERQKLKPHYANRNFHLCWPKCALVVDTRRP